MHSYYNTNYRKNAEKVKIVLPDSSLKKLDTVIPLSEILKPKCEPHRYNKVSKPLAKSFSHLVI